MNLTDNVILITGGTSGIGRALAEAFHQLGNKVIITGRRKQLLAEITQKHTGMVGIELDVRDEASVSEFAKNIIKQHPKLNILINNAGISRPQDLLNETDVSVSRDIIQTNILSVLQLTNELLPVLKEQPKSTIITTTSGLAFVPRHNYSSYCASKAFLHSWLQSLRTQLKETSIDVLELAPPYVQTELAGLFQTTDPAAMPLADYISEVMQLLAESSLPNDEILVEKVKFLRMAESNGQYEKAYNMLNA